MKGNSPDPAEVGMNQGLIKYELQTANRGGSGSGPVRGTVLLQLIEPSKIKLEIFSGKTADQIPGFTTKVRIYHR